MAPEVLLQQEITEKVDVYSFAIILWELLTQQFAFSDVKGFRQIKAAVCQGFRPPLPPDVFITLNCINGSFIAYSPN